MRSTPSRSDENCTPCEWATSDLHPPPDRSKDLDSGDFSTAKSAQESSIRSKFTDLIRHLTRPHSSASSGPIRPGPVLRVMGHGSGRGYISSALKIDKSSPATASTEGTTLQDQARPADPQCEKCSV